MVHPSRLTLSLTGSEWETYSENEEKIARLLQDIMTILVFISL